MQSIVICIIGYSTTPVAFQLSIAALLFRTSPKAKLVIKDYKAMENGSQN